jgi:hypothetical protein
MKIFGRSRERRAARGHGARWGVSTTTIAGLLLIGGHEPCGWKLADRLTAIAYVALSLWLVATRVALLA